MSFKIKLLYKIFFNIFHLIIEKRWKPLYFWKIVSSFKLFFNSNWKFLTYLFIYLFQLFLHLCQIILKFVFSDSWDALVTNKYFFILFSLFFFMSWNLKYFINCVASGALVCKLMNKPATLTRCELFSVATVIKRNVLTIFHYQRNIT